MKNLFLEWLKGELRSEHVALDRAKKTMEAGDMAYLGVFNASLAVHLMLTDVLEKYEELNGSPSTQDTPYQCEYEIPCPHCGTADNEKVLDVMQAGNIIAMRCMVCGHEWPERVGY